MYICDKWKQGPDSVDDKISEYLHNPWPSQSPEHASLISHIADIPYQTEKEEVILLSSISNYDWLPTPGISTDKISKDTTSRLDSQMVYYLKHDEDYLQLHQYTPRNHLPTSPHLRLLYLTTNLGYEHAKTWFVHYLLKTDCPDTSEENIDIIEQPQQPPHKRRKQTPRIISISPENLSQASGLQLDEILNSALTQCTLYTKFQEDMLTQGTINWRLNDEEEGNICVMR